jgi:arylformamidase
VKQWIDISRPITPDMPVWPGTPQPVIERVESMERGDSCNVTHLNLSAHTGTHMDAPFHFLNNGAAIEALPLDAVMGPARVIDVPDPVCIRPEHLPHDLGLAERVLFKTASGDLCWPLTRFVEDFVWLSAAAARILAERRTRCVGIDYLSVGGFRKDLVETHEILLSAGVWIIEGLDLRHVPAGRYELACLPLKLPGCDGAPARAALRPL